MRTIVAIGGGEIGRTKKLEDGSIKTYPVETTAIDRQIVQMTGKKSPCVLFLPTASFDNAGYCETFEKHYGERLGCQVSFLLLVNPPSKQEIKDKILSADIIYVGGGNTQFMQDTWKERGVLPLLKQAYEKGTILCGLSAGANCWFEHSSTDSFMTEEDRYDIQKAKESVAIMDNLGYIKGTCCPHYLAEAYRRPSFLYQMKNMKGVGYGIDNCAALVFKNEKLSQVLKSKPTAKAFEITSQNGTREKSIVFANP